MAKIRKKVKLIGIWISIMAVSFATVFVIGTFNPNWIILDKLEKKYAIENMASWKSLGVMEPSIEYSNNKEFVVSVSRCIAYLNLNVLPEERIHREIIIAMAVLETGYGTSRFANEGNNLFGIRTWDQQIPQLKPLGNPDVVWGVKAYETKCQSVKDMINTINNHHAYELFRIERANQLKSKNIDINKQVELLNKWSTNPSYTDLVKQKVLSVRKILENA